MGEFAGIDLGKEVLNFHVVDAKGATVRRGRAPATPQAARQALNGLDLERVGVEAGPYGAWLVEGLRGLPGGDSLAQFLGRHRKATRRPRSRQR